MAGEDADELAKQVRHLTARVYELERRLGVAPPPPPGASAPPSQATPAPQAAASEAAGPAAWAPGPLPPSAATRPSDIESTLGVRGLTALGTLVLVLGGAWFVLYFLGEVQQILAGILGGVALVALGEALHRRGRYGSYPYFLVGGGIVLAYFSVHVGYAIEAYRVATGMTIALDALLLGVVAAAGVGLALRYDSRALAAEAFVLGFLTTRLGEPGTAAAAEVELIALAYVAILAAALLAVVALKRWTDVGLGGAVLTWLALAALRRDLQASPWLFALVVGVVAIELWILALRAADADATRGAAVAAVASGGAAVLLWWNARLLDPASADEVLLLLAVAHVGMAFVLRQPGLRGVAGLAAAALAFAWAPAALDDQAVTIVWAALVAALAVAAWRLPSGGAWLAPATYAGAGLLFVRAFFLDANGAVGDAPAAALSIASVAVATAALALAYLAFGGVGAAERASPPWALLVAAVATPLPWMHVAFGNYASIAWAVEGALLVAGGFALARRDLRLAGIGLLLLVVARVLLVDATNLPLAWRVVVYLAVGALILATAFLFARDRGRREAA